LAACALAAVAIFSASAQEPPPPPYTPLDAEQLDQLVAPIALYPDSLVAQILTASTYPRQVGDADNWVHQNASMPPTQQAQAANGMPWDPSVKSLVAFPSVLDQMTRNYNWTNSLGNAYYNQPGDVMNAVQAMRLRARQAGALRSTPQERVYDNGGLIVIQPVNPELVYVPYYNPWVVYGPPVPVYAGFWVPPPPRGIVLSAGIGFAAGISVGLFAHYGWGYHAWEPNWRGGVVVYNHTTYISRSTTVINRGHFGGYNRFVYERGGRGVPGNFHPPVTARSAMFSHPEPGRYMRTPGTYRDPARNAAHPPAAHGPGMTFGHQPAARPQGPQERANMHPAPGPQPGARFGHPAPAAARPMAPQNHEMARPSPMGHPQGGGGGHPQGGHGHEGHH
jgi:hypothetical protein